MKRALAWAVLLASGPASGPVWAGGEAELKEKLASDDDGAAIDAARRLGELEGPKALDVILDGLAVGAPPRVQAELLGALKGKRDPRSVDVLKLYARNRNPEVRKKAVAVLAELPPSDPRVVPVLLSTLSDSVEEVRAVAALALGKRKERSAEGKLVKLLQHKDAAAASALAQMATPELAHKLAEMLGQVPDALLCAVLGEMLTRPDFGPEPIRGEVVKALAKVPGIDATAALIDYVAKSEKDKLRPSRLEAQKIIDQRSNP